MCFGGCVLCGWCTSGEQARKVFSLKLHSFILDITRERTEAGWIAARLVDLLNSLIEEVTTSITYESRNFDIVTWNCIKKIAMHNFQVAIVYRLNHNANRDLRWIYEYDNRKPTDDNKTRQPLRAKVLRKLFDVIKQTNNWSPQTKTNAVVFSPQNIKCLTQRNVCRLVCCEGECLKSFATQTNGLRKVLYVMFYLILSLQTLLEKFVLIFVV